MVSLETVRISPSILCPLAELVDALLDMSADPNTPLPLLGFPVLNDTERTPCGTFGLKPCSRDGVHPPLLGQASADDRETPSNFS